MKHSQLPPFHVGDLVVFDFGGDGPPPAPQYTKIYKSRNPGLVLSSACFGLGRDRYRILWRNGEETTEHVSFLRPTQ